MLRLPDVTVVAVANDAVRQITDWVLDRTAKIIEPAAVVCSDIRGSYDATLWDVCANDVKTSHCLVIQYDGFPIDPWMWRDEFLKYDFIGAPWPVRGYVGNGGFSLRSTKLCRRLAQLPVGKPEDGAVRIYYDDGKLGDCVYAPVSVGHQFAFERCPKRRAFGFHGIYNVGKVLPKPELEEWMALAPDAVRSKVEWQELEASLK